MCHYPALNIFDTCSVVLLMCYICIRFFPRIRFRVTSCKKLGTSLRSHRHRSMRMDSGRFFGRASKRWRVVIDSEKVGLVRGGGGGGGVLTYSLTRLLLVACSAVFPPPPLPRQMALFHWLVCVYGSRALEKIDRWELHYFPLPGSVAVVCSCPSSCVPSVRMKYGRG